MKSGVDLRFNTIISRLEKTRDCVLAHLSDGSVIEADVVMFATGRRPNTDGIGLENAGVILDKRGAIVVDGDYRTSAPNIYAVGDVTDRINLTPVAIAEGHALADTLFGGNPRGVGYDNVASAVFSSPPVGTVGLTEGEARAKFGEVDIYRSSFRPMKHTLGGRDERTMMKLVVERATDRVVGCHMVGLDAPEITQGRGDRAQLRRHQGPVRPYHRHPPNGRGRTGHHAHQGPGTGGCGRLGRRLTGAAVIRLAGVRAFLRSASHHAPEMS